MLYQSVSVRAEGREGQVRGDQGSYGATCNRKGGELMQMLRFSVWGRGTLGVQGTPAPHMPISVLSNSAFCLACLFQTKSCYVALAGLEFTMLSRLALDSWVILLPLPPRYWDCRRVPPCLADCVYSEAVLGPRR